MSANEIAAVLAGRPTLHKIPLHSASCKECVGWGKAAMAIRAEESFLMPFNGEAH